jgi:hypothetical protein
MKSSLFIIFFILFVFLSNSLLAQVVQGQKQAQAQATSVKVQTTNITRRPLVLSPEKTDIKTPIEVDLNNYTHLALVDINSLNRRSKSIYNLYADRLLSSPLTIVNPIVVDKRRWKKSPLFLKNEKNPDWLYLYYTRQGGSGNDDVNTTVIVRDYKNNIIYSASHTNTGIPQILYPLIGF